MKFKVVFVWIQCYTCRVWASWSPTRQHRPNYIHHSSCIGPSSPLPLRRGAASPFRRLV